MRWTPGSAWGGGGVSDRAALPASEVYDPDDLLSRLTPPPDAQPEASLLYGYLHDRLSARLKKLVWLRRESERSLARMMRVALKSLLLGRLELRSVPYDRVALALYQHLFYKYLYMRLVAAFDDYVCTGLGGLAFTPLGVSMLRPEQVFAFPSFARPRWTARVVAVDLDVARAMFGRGIEPDVGTRDMDYWSDAPAVYVIERVYPNQIEYFTHGRLRERIPRPVGHGHLLITGEMRTVRLYEWPRDLDRIHHDSPESGLLAGDAPFSLRYNTERDKEALDLPVGLVELAAGAGYQGYNLLAWHDILLDAMLRRVRRGNVVAVRADLLDTADEATRAFLDYYEPIATMGGEAISSAIQFLDVVPYDELKAMHIEILSQFAALTGVTHQMLQQVGVSEIASEVVAMQMQSNARINQLHQYVASWVARALDRFRLYLTTIPETAQELVQLEVSPGGQEYEKYGSSLLVGYGGQAKYDELLSNVFIEPSLLGELSMVARRNELIQGLQVVAQAIPIMAQMGQMYDLGKIIDQILVTLNINPADMRVEVVQQDMQQGIPTPESGQ